MSVTIQFEEQTFVRNLALHSSQIQHAVFVHETRRSFPLHLVELGAECLPTGSLIRIISIVESTEQGSTYRGMVDATPVIVKFAVWRNESEERLRKEAQAYYAFSLRIPPTDPILPKSFGLYVADSPDRPIAERCNLSMLVLQDCGNVIDQPLYKLPQHEKVEILKLLGRFHQYTQSHIVDFDESNVVNMGEDQYRLIPLHNIEQHECRFQGDWQLNRFYPNRQKFGCPDLLATAYDAGLWTVPKKDKEAPKPKIGDINLPHLPPQRVIDEIIPREVLPLVTVAPHLSRVHALLKQIHQEYPDGNVPVARIVEAKSTWSSVGLPMTINEAKSQIAHFESNPSLYQYVFDYRY
ncbi:hypothetical protein VKT23_006890 [Stygiomarasmius scandens]|uniref:Protein kinase domain-containing protein n=1 Tax=Marasmiellus scandens TaxID=2682957 RepID=A0ABR1JQG1_9AGAR